MGDYVKNKSIDRGFKLIYGTKNSLGRVIIEKVLLFAMEIDKIISHYGYIVIISSMFSGFSFKLMSQNTPMKQERDTI